MAIKKSSTNFSALDNLFGSSTPSDKALTKTESQVIGKKKAALNTLDNIFGEDNKPFEPAWTPPKEPSAFQKLLSKTGSAISSGAKTVASKVSEISAKNNPDNKSVIENLFPNAKANTIAQNNANLFKVKGSEEAAKKSSLYIDPTGVEKKEPKYGWEIINTPFAKKTVTQIEEDTSDLGVKAVAKLKSTAEFLGSSAVSAKNKAVYLADQAAKKIVPFYDLFDDQLIKSLSTKTDLFKDNKEDIRSRYEKNLDKMLAKRNNPNNPEAIKFLYDLQDAGPQTLIGVALGFIPYAGPAAATGYFTALSSAEQIKERGKVTSPLNVAIDTVGDRLLGGILGKLAKVPKKMLMKALSGFATEGGTEVGQTILKLSNDYRNAKSDEERNNIFEGFKSYVANGDMLREFGLGGVIGAGVSVSLGGISTSNTTEEPKTPSVAPKMTSPEAITPKPNVSTPSNVGVQELTDKMVGLDDIFSTFKDSLPVSNKVNVEEGINEVVSTKKTEPSTSVKLDDLIVKKEVKTDIYLEKSGDNYLFQESSLKKLVKAVKGTDSRISDENAYSKASVALKQANEAFKSGQNAVQIAEIGGRKLETPIRLVKAEMKGKLPEDTIANAKPAKIEKINPEQFKYAGWSSEMESQYEAFKKVMLRFPNPRVRDKMTNGDAETFKNVVKAYGISPERVDNMLYSQEKTNHEVFDEFLDRFYNRNKPVEDFDQKMIDYYTKLEAEESVKKDALEEIRTDLSIEDIWGSVDTISDNKLNALIDKTEAEIKQYEESKKTEGAEGKTSSSEKNEGAKTSSKEEVNNLVREALTKEPTIEGDISAEIEERANEDWESNPEYGEKIGELFQKAEDISKEISQEKNKETKAKLQKELDGINEKMNDIHESFIKKWESISKQEKAVEKTKGIFQKKTSGEISYPNKNPESGVKIYGHLKDGIAKLDSIEITPAKRKQGLGSKYVAEFEKWAKDNGAKMIKIDAYKKSELFWEKKGYKMPKEYPVENGVVQDYKPGVKSLNEVFQKKISSNQEYPRYVNNNQWVEGLTKKFGDTVKLYHQTDSDNVPDILKNGFKSEGEFGDDVFFVMEEKIDRVGGKGSDYLIVEVPKTHYDRLFPDERSMDIFTEKESELDGDDKEAIMRSYILNDKTSKGFDILMNADEVKPEWIKKLSNNPFEKKVSVSNNYLSTEAKKFKTADEFINSQINAYHGTPNKEFDEFKLGMRNNSENETNGLGVWVTPQVAAAKTFSNKIEGGLFGYGSTLTDVGGTVMPVSLRLKNPKIYRSTKGMESILDEIEALEKAKPSVLRTSPNFESDYEVRQAAIKEREIISAKIAKLRKKYRRDAFEKFMDDRDKFAKYISNGAKWEDRYIALEVSETNRKFINYLKQQGYDGIIIKGTEYDAKGAGLETIDQIVAFDPKDVLTRAQLRKIWEEANQKVDSFEKKKSPTWKQNPFKAKDKEARFDYLNRTPDQARAELYKMFPKNDVKLVERELGSVEINGDIFGKDIRGNYVVGDGVINVVMNDGRVNNRVVYHEAFHHYLNTYMPFLDKGNLVNSYYREHKAELDAKYGDYAQEMRGEESLADWFADYRAGRMTFTGRVQALFDKIVRHIKGLVGKLDGNDEIIKTFEKVIAGEAKTMKKKQIFSNNRVVFNKKIKLKPSDLSSEEHKALEGAIEKISEVNTKVDVPKHIIASLPFWNDKAALFMSRETMERNLDDIAGAYSPEIKEFLTERVKMNETMRAVFSTTLREKIEADVVKRLGIKKGSPLSALVQRFGEGEINQKELMEKTDKWPQVIEAAEYLRNVYDNMLDMWNDVRKSFGYEPVPKRKDYFRHGNFMSSFDSIGVILRENDLPTSISGRTYMFKPGTPFSTAALKRMGVKTDYDAVGGIDNYINAVSRSIFHTDSVQRGRALESVIGKGSEIIENENLEIRKRNKERMDQNSNEQREPEIPEINLPNFQANLIEWTNLLSGKKSLLDRGGESTAGRRLYTIVNWLRSRVAANMIGGNISSAITNFIPVTQLLATTNKVSVARGLAEVPRGIADSRIIDGQKSGFLSRRFMKEQIGMSPWDKTKAGLNYMFKAVDLFTSRWVVSSKYYENLSKGMSKVEALKDADNYAGKVITDRSIGQLPNIFGSKTLGIFTQFQTEVNNQWSFITKDMPLMSKGNKLKLLSMFIQFFLYSYLFNELYEKLIGRRPAIDPIYDAMTLAGQTVEGKNKPLAKRTGLALESLAGNLPGVGGLTGGRYPLFAGLPDILGTLKGEKDINKGILAPAYYLVFPVAGGQVKKTYEGLTAFNEGGSYSKAGLLQFPIDQTPENLIKTGVFGKYSTGDSKLYYGEERSPLGKNQTKEYKRLLENNPSQARPYYDRIIDKREKKRDN